MADEVEADEMWSFVQNKSNQKCLWHAISHETAEVLAYIIDSHHDKIEALPKAIWDRTLLY